jgi:hypothetical protein
MRRQGWAEQQALDDFNDSLRGLSCRVDPDLIIRARHPDWSRWDRVRILWTSVSDDRDATRVAVGLMPEDLAAVHQHPHHNTAATFSRGWARRPLVEATLRYTIAALRSESLPSDNPFDPREQAIEQWARALALHYLGIRELRPDAVARYAQHSTCKAALAGVRAGGLSPDIAGLLTDINYLYSGRVTETNSGRPDVSFELFCAVAIAFACGALEGRTPASASQIQRLKRQLPPEFDVMSVADLPKLALNGRFVPVPTHKTDKAVRSRTTPDIRSGRSHGPSGSSGTQQPTTRAGL